jgi:hypothetical protein
VWAIYPRTAENLRVLRALYGQGNKFLKCCKELENGVFVVQKSGETLLLPPYTLHNTFAIGGSITCVYSFEAIEFFPTMISSLYMEMEYIDSEFLDEIDRHREYSSKLETWLDGLEHTLRTGDNTTKQKVVETWITSILSIKATFQKASCYENRACDIWREFLNSTMISQCPCSSSDPSSFHTHMMSQHVEVIRTQRPKKRARHS